VSGAPNLARKSIQTLLTMPSRKSRVVKEMGRGSNFFTEKQALFEGENILQF